MTRDLDSLPTNDLQDLAARLPRDVAPPPELWSRIAARLDARASCTSLEEWSRDLPADIAPPADLWPQIAERLQAKPRERRRSLRFAAAAAAIGAAAVLATIAVRYDGGDRVTGPSTASSPASIDPATGPAPGATLDASWILRSPVIAEDVAASLRRDLALVRDERLQIEAALDTEPSDSGLRALWAHTYQAELRLSDTLGRTLMSYEIG